MERQLAIIKSAENGTDFNNVLEYVQECLHLRALVNQSLEKALDSLLGSSMTMAANMLLSRRDNYLRSCSKDMTEDDIRKLRNAPFTSNEVFPSDTLSEVQRNFIQWTHVNRDFGSRDSRKEHTSRHEEKRDNRPQNRSFRPYHDNSSSTSTKGNASSSAGNRGTGSYSSRPFRGRGGRRKPLSVPRKPSVQFLAGMGNQKSSSKGCDHYEGGLLSKFQKSISIDILSCNKDKISEPGETRIFDKGGLSNDQQKNDNSSSKGHFPGILQSVVCCPPTRKEMATSKRSECGK